MSQLFIVWANCADHKISDNLTVTGAGFGISKPMTSVPGIGAMIRNDFVFNAAIISGLWFSINAILTQVSGLILICTILGHMFRPSRCTGMPNSASLLLIISAWAAILISSHAIAYTGFSNNDIGNTGLDVGYTIGWYVDFSGSILFCHSFCSTACFSDVLKLLFVDGCDITFSGWGLDFSGIFCLSFATDSDILIVGTSIHSVRRTRTNRAINHQTITIFAIKLFHNNGKKYAMIGHESRPHAVSYAIFVCHTILKLNNALNKIAITTSCFTIVHKVLWRKNNATQYAHTSHAMICDHHGPTKNDHILVKKRKNGAWDAKKTHQK